MVAFPYLTNLYDLMVDPRKNSLEFYILHNRVADISGYFFFSCFHLLNKMVNTVQNTMDQFSQITPFTVQRMWPIVLTNDF